VITVFIPRGVSRRGADTVTLRVITVFPERGVGRHGDLVPSVPATRRESCR
jgi:hypothetical protein